MNFLYVLAVIAAAVSAQEYELEIQPQDDINLYPDWYINTLNSRHRRDVTLDRKVGADGRVFGTLGSNDNGLFGKAGYEHNIFNDHSGKLDASAHGTRVLSPYGDSSHLGGSLNWQKPNAAASLDVSRQIHGRTTIDAAAGGKWPVGRNGDFSVQGFHTQTQGLNRDYGGRANFNYRW